MEWYYNASKNSIYDDIDFLCRSTSASYPILDKRRNVLNAYYDVARLIWESCDDWAWDDTNTTDGYPLAYRTLAAASANYEMPTNIFSVEQVEVKDGAAQWQKLDPIDSADFSVSPEEYMDTGGTPRYYDIVGTQIRLFPPPGTGYVTLSSGLCLRLSREPSAFASAATTSPGFAKPFHRLLSVRASLDFEQDPNQRSLLKEMRDRLERGLSRFYSHRMAESPNRVFPKSKRNWRQYR